MDMPLVEAVTIELGSAIAKSILKLWVKDSPVGDNISSSLIDLLKARTSDALAQRRGRRQFEKIGEMVGENLLPLFENENASLDEGSRTAVALAVANVFNMLSSDLLAERNLDPAELAKHLLAKYPPEKQHFNDIEKELYQRIINVSCPYIVDIASQLPAFTENTFAEVLKREDRLITTANQILQEVRRISERLGSTEAGLFERDYRQAVVRKLDQLQLFGIDTLTANRRYRLSVAYITLSIEQKSSSLYNKKKHKGGFATKTIEDSQEENGRGILLVDEALAHSRRLLIRGPAGSGKTTLLQWIAVNVASRSFGGYLSDWNDTLPFYIPLRQCVQSVLPRPEAFPEFVASTIIGTMPGAWVHTQLNSGRGIVLIDGLDEVPAIQRARVREWLKELVETYSKVALYYYFSPARSRRGLDEL